MNKVQKLLKQLIEDPEPGLMEAMEAVDKSEDPGQWEDLIWRMSVELGRGTLEKRLAGVQEPPGVTCAQCAAVEQPPSQNGDAGLSPP